MAALTRDTLAAVVLDYLKALEDYDAPYIDDDAGPRSVVIDGRMDMLKFADAILAAIPAAAPAPDDIVGVTADFFSTRIFMAQMLADAGGTVKVRMFEPDILNGKYGPALYQTENPPGYCARLEDADGNQPESLTTKNSDTGGTK